VPKKPRYVLPQEFLQRIAAGGNLAHSELSWSVVDNHVDLFDYWWWTAIESKTKNEVVHVCSTEKNEREISCIPPATAWWLWPETFQNSSENFFGCCGGDGELSEKFRSIFRSLGNKDPLLERWISQDLSIFSFVLYVPST
jgi:hypothetical protein